MKETTDNRLTLRFKNKQEKEAYERLATSRGMTISEFGRKAFKNYARMFRISQDDQLLEEKQAS